MRQLGGSALAVRHRERRAAVDHARQRPLAPAQIVEQAEADLTDEARALSDARQKRRQRRFPGPRHHQRMAVAFRLEPLRQRPMLGERQALAGEIGDDCLADARHIVGERGHHPRAQHVHRPSWKAPVQEPDHGVAAHEVTDPHVGDKQDRGAAAGLCRCAGIVPM